MLLGSWPRPRRRRCRRARGFAVRPQPKAFVRPQPPPVYRALLAETCRRACSLKPASRQRRRTPRGKIQVCFVLRTSAGHLFRFLTREFSFAFDWQSIEKNKEETFSEGETGVLVVLSETKREGTDLPQDQCPCLYLSSPMEN